MVQLLGFTISSQPRKRTVEFGDEEDNGYRDVYLTHLKSFKFVALFIWVFCGFVTVSNWWGDPIDCFSDTHSIVSNKIMTSYCFITINAYQW